MNILVLDEDKAQLETIGRGLFLYGHQAIMAASFEEAYQCVSTANDKRPIDLMIIDLSHNGDYRFNIIKEMLEKSPELPVLVIMGINANEEMKKVKELGIPMLKKPFDPNLLNQSITKLMASTPLPAAAADAN